MDARLNSFDKQIYKDLRKLADDFYHSTTLRVNRMSIYNTAARVVLFSPATNKSWYGSSYHDLGLDRPHQRVKFIESIKNDLTLNKNNYLYLDRAKYNEQIYERFKYHMENKLTYISFRRSSNLSQLDSLITSIRNSFAHGNFIIKDRTYIIWNINYTDCNALIVISNEKLEKLLKLIMPKYYDDFR